MIVTNDDLLMGITSTKLLAIILRWMVSSSQSTLCSLSVRRMCCSSMALGNIMTGHILFVD